jgi:HK97 family phage portal protein
MGLLSWAAQKFGLANVSEWAKIREQLGYGNWAGKPVTHDNAMEISAWWRSVKLYAEVTGAMSLKFYERIADDNRKPAPDHYVAELISLSPNIDQTPLEFWGCQSAALCISGNAFAEKKFSGDRLVTLEPLPFTTRPYRRSDGSLWYCIPGRPYSDDLPRDKVFHTKGFNLGGDLGLSPLTAARQALSISLATEEAVGKTFAQGMRLSGFFTGPLSNETQRKDFKEVFIDPITGNDAKAHYGILPPSFDFKTINIPPKDAEMLLSRKHNIEDVARFMGVPPILLGHASDGQTMWGSGVENIILAWLTLGLDSFLRNIESSINKRLLLPGDRRKYYAEFDRDSLLRADSAARAALINSQIQNAQMTPNEGRKKLNRLPVDGGDVALVNSTLIPLTQVGNRVARVQHAPGEPIPEPTP